LIGHVSVIASQSCFPGRWISKFTSYNNNLHPNKFPEVYHTIEKLVETALPAWDQCLAVANGSDETEVAERMESGFPYPNDPE
jgi:hypothetical protein